MTKPSISVQELSERIAEKAKAEPSKRFWGLYTHVCKPEVLRMAYDLAKQNRGASGIDGVTFEQVEAEGADVLIATLSRELQERSYKPLPSRRVQIEKEEGGKRVLKIPAIRDRVVQGALVIIMQPIFEADFQAGSFGYRPGRKAHDALERVKTGLYKQLHQVIDLDLKAYFDTVRHDLLLSKIARRIQDDDVMALCKMILKASGQRGLPQGSVVGPLWANVFLNDVDRMLEEAQRATKQGDYEVISYTRFADDLVVQVSNHPKARHWIDAVWKRLKEELAKLDLTINEDKTKVVNFTTGEPFGFLGYDFRWVNQRSEPKKKMVLCTPKKKKVHGIAKRVQEALNRSRNMPIAEAVRERINPIVRGWVNFFGWGNPGRAMSFVSWQVDMKVRRFASRQRPKRKGGRAWTTWSHQEIYQQWGLFNDYKVDWCSESSRAVT